MNAIKLKKCIYSLGFLLFFVFVFLSKENTITASANSTVEVPSTKETQAEIKLNVKSKSIVKEKSYPLKVYNVSEEHKITFKSSDTSIATVDETGLVTAIELGNATITVTVKDGFKTISTLTCEITVGPPAISVKLTKSELVMIVGKKTSLVTILQPSNTVEEVKFFASDSSIASVSPGGRITANAVGTAYICAIIDNGKFDACKVIVVDEETFQKMLEEAAVASSEAVNGESNTSDPSVTATPTPSVTPTLSATPTPSATPIPAK